MKNFKSKRLNAVKNSQSKWWTGGFESVDVGASLRVIPFWETNSIVHDRIPIRIDPGPAFGLGDHPTTIMALELLEVSLKNLKNHHNSLSVLDVGCGVGVLAIASLLLGATNAVAIDIDPVAVNIAKRNWLTNKVMTDLKDQDAIALCVGGIESIRGKFDLVIANLVAPLLLRISKNLSENTRNLLLLSGIYETMAKDVEDVFTEEGFLCLDSRSKGEWRSFMFKKC
ncbi:MAG: 50S ribosomal protein L11 methyltransferase [Desulfomonilaceae bacterium]